MTNKERTQENSGNHSGTNSVSKILIVVELPDGKATIATYAVDQIVEKPLKVFGHEPVGVASHDKLPNRYRDIFMRISSTVTTGDEGQTRQSTSQKETSKSSN